MAAILILGAMPYVGASSGVQKTSASIGGKTANLVYVAMGGKRTIIPAIANGSMSTDAVASGIIKAVDADKNVTVVAAINGGYFNSYYNKNIELSVPNNYPRVFSTIVKDGQVVNAGGTINAIGITYEGKVYIDRDTIKPSVTFDRDVTITVWGVNVLSSDAGAVSVFTDDFNYSMSIPSTSQIVLVKNNAVASVKKGEGAFTVPDGYTAIVLQLSCV